MKFDALPSACFLVFALWAGCGDAGSEPCLHCPDVGGRFDVVRTINSATGCPQPPSGGPVQVLVRQNGSRLELEYEGELHRGVLTGENRVRSESAERADAGNRFRSTRQLEVTFTEDPSKKNGMRFQAVLHELRTPTSPSINEGKVCEITGTLVGAR